MKEVELKEKTTDKKIVSVTIPKGKFASFCCADCSYAGNYNSNRRQYWCGHYDRWVDGNDSCDYGRRNSD